VPHQATLSAACPWPHGPSVKLNLSLTSCAGCALCEVAGARWRSKLLAVALAARRERPRSAHGASPAAGGYNSTLVSGPAGGPRAVFRELVGLLPRHPHTFPTSSLACIANLALPSNRTIPPPAPTPARCSTARLLPNSREHHSPVRRLPCRPSLAPPCYTCDPPPALQGRTPVTVSTTLERSLLRRAVPRNPRQQPAPQAPRARDRRPRPACERAHPPPAHTRFFRVASALCGGDQVCGKAAGREADHSARSALSSAGRQELQGEQWRGRNPNSLHRQRPDFSF
jgi:hypothetical protein